MYASIGENLYGFTSRDSYDASRLNLIDRIRGQEVEGKPMAAVPTRVPLYITGSEDELGLTMTAELAGQSLGGPYTLSGVPLILNPSSRDRRNVVDDFRPQGPDERFPWSSRSRPVSRTRRILRFLEGR